MDASITCIASEVSFVGSVHGVKKGSYCTILSSSGARVLVVSGSEFASNASRVVSFTGVVMTHSFEKIHVNVAF